MAEQSRTFKTLVIAASNAATALVSLLIAAILSRHFDYVDYATYRQTLLAYHFVGPLLALGLPAALYFFLPGEKRRARAVLLENLLLLALSGSVFALFLVCGGNLLIADRFSNPDLKITLLVFALYPVLFLPTTSTGSTLVAQNRVAWLTFHTIGTRLARLALVGLAILIFPHNPVAVVGATAISGGVVLLSGLVLMLRAVPRGEENRPTRGGMTSQLKYAVPIGLALMMEGIALSIDQVLVSALCRPEEYAVFVNGAMEIPFLKVLTAAATAVILPELVAFYKDGKKTEALGLWLKGARKLSLLILPMGGLLFVVAPDLMTVLYSAEYTESSGPFRIYLLLLPARMVFFTAIFQAAGRSDLILRRAVGTLILNAVISFPLVYYFGMEGAAWGTVIVFWGYVIPYCMRVCSRLLEIRWFNLMPLKHIGLNMLAITLAGVAAIQLRSLVSVEGGLPSGMVLGFFYVGILALLFFIFFPAEMKASFQSVRGRLQKSRTRG
jgi:O-antigen/teichoic acid export membrane protein